MKATASLKMENLDFAGGTFTVGSVIADASRSRFRTAARPPTAGLSR